MGASRLKQNMENSFIQAQCCESGKFLVEHLEIMISMPVPLLVIFWVINKKIILAAI